jgi:glycosyltransferase involved in cell wall biosynthesis
MQELAWSAEDIGIVGCRLVNADGNLVHAGTYMPVPSFWGQEYPGNERDIGQYSADREVEGVIAACVYIKRQVIDEIGPLDEDYFSYYEDTDFCLKAARAGWRTFCSGVTNASTDVNRMDFSGTFRQSRETFLSKWRDHYEKRYTQRLTWHSYISGQGIYSRASAKALWALDRAGVDVNLAFLEGADRAELDDFRINDMKNRGKDRGRPQVLFGPPEMLSRADGAYNIGYVFTPYERFDERAVKELNRMDEVWVTSGWQKDAALASGVKREVYIMPLAVDPDYLSPGITSFPLEGRFVFIAQVEWGDSYATATLLRAFTDEFGEDEKVVLIANVRSPVSVDEEAGGWAAEAAIAGGSAEVEESVEAMALPLNRAQVVFVVDHEIEPCQMASLYRSADCAVVVNRSAEPGTAVLDPLACGVPVIATGWGTASELVEGGAVRGVECTLVTGTDGTGRWADPDYARLREALRAGREHGEEDSRKALEVSAGLRETRTWDGLAAKILERLEAIGRR